MVDYPLQHFRATDIHHRIADMIQFNFIAAFQELLSRIQRALVNHIAEYINIFQIDKFGQELENLDIGPRKTHRVKRIEFG